MADLGNVLSAATQYGNDREAEGRAEERETHALEVAELNARILAAEKALADHMATHEPEPAVCPAGTDRAGQEIPDGETDAWCTIVVEPEPVEQVFGTSYGGADESFNDGRDQVARIFFRGNVPSDPFEDSNVEQAFREGVRHFVFSWKGSQPGSSIADAFRIKPDGVTVYGCYWHEPEDNIPGSMSLSAWTARHKEHAAAMRSVGVIPVTILMQYTLTAGSGRDVTDYYVGDDGFLFDAYFNPAKGKDNPEAVVDRCVAAAKEAGAKFAGLGETGVPNSVALDTTLSLTRRLRAKLLATPFMRVNCYWPTGEFEFRNDEHATAWFGTD